MKIPLILAVVGLAGGTVAGHFLKPSPPPDEMEAKGEKGDHKDMAKDGHDDKMEKEKTDSERYAQKAKESRPPIPDQPIDADYVKLSKQFVVPIVEGTEVGALIVMSMALEADLGISEVIFQYEPKLRDEFLQVLFKHARSGGFSGVFTAEQVMEDLRDSLLYAAQSVLGKQIRGVLVTDIVRQDI